MLPDRVSNPGPLTYESGALPIALRGPAKIVSVRRDLKGMSYIPISFRMINSCQNMYIKCISL